ncbi:MAG: AAA family ATPase [Acidobacteriota bacterium]
MKLLRLEVRHWRGLNQTLEDLHEGLNLIVGPNEAGKSRLFQALEFGLFESTKGKSQYKKELATWGSSEKPFVAVAFEHRGERYEVEKTFLTADTSTVLRGAGRSWKDSEAEAQLRELFEVQTGSGRTQDLATYGLWPLLWVRQEKSLTAPHDDLHDAPRQRLESLLSETAGEIAAGSRGEAVLAAARAEAKRFWTDTYRPTGELKTAEQAYTAARQATQDAVERRDQVQRQSQRLGEKRQALVHAEAALEPLRERLVEAQQGAQRLDELRRRQQLETEAAEAADQRWKQAAQQQSSRRELEQAVGKGEGDLAAQQQELEAAGRAAEEAAQQLKQAEARVLEAEEAGSRAQDLLDAVQRRERVQNLEKEAKGLRRRLTQAAELKQELEGLARNLAPLPMEEQVQVIRRGEGELREAAAGLEAAGAHLRVVALQDLDLHLSASPGLAEAGDGGDQSSGENSVSESLEAGQTRELSITAPQLVELPGIARFQIDPGGDLSALQQRHRDAERRVSRALSKISQPSLQAAEEALAQRRELQQAQQVAQQRLESLEEDGDLSSRLASVESQLEAESRALKSFFGERQVSFGPSGKVPGTSAEEEDQSPDTFSDPSGDGGSAVQGNLPGTQQGNLPGTLFESSAEAVPGKVSGTSEGTEGKVPGTNTGTTERAEGKVPGTNVGSLSASVEVTDLTGLSSVQQALRQARDEVRSRRSERDALRQPRESALTRQQEYQRRVDQLTEGLRRDSERLQQLPTAEELSHQEEELRRAQRDAQDRRDEVLRELESLRQSVGEHALGQAQRALEHKQAERDALHQEVVDLDAEIRIHGEADTGLHDAVQQSAAEASRAWSELQRIGLQADAARTLRQTLETQRSAARQRLAAPVRQAIEPYLQRLFPGSTLDLADDWSVEGLHTGSERETLTALSGGAREQLGLLVRLGLARLFARDHRLPVLLDDTLTHTDSQRLQTFQQILVELTRSSAASSGVLQILLFTCHGKTYDSLGPDKVFRLEGRGRG